MAEKPLESWRARAAVSEALDIFNSSYMQEVWAKALARRESDPEGAVTTARTLLESVCKHILDAANKEFRQGASLPELYKLTAEVLEIAPTEQIEPIFKSLFGACAEVIANIGRLRNELSDSHGRGPFGQMPDWRHAELAVHLSGAMATYLAAAWKGRQPTVRNVIEMHIAQRQEAGGPVDSSNEYELKRIARDLEDFTASKLRASDIVTYFEERAAQGLKAPTVYKNLSILRRAMGNNSAKAFEDAAQILNTKFAPSYTFVPRNRRVSPEDVEAVIRYFQERSEDRRNRTQMVDTVEFAVWSGRGLSDICKLRWDDVDFDKKTCKLPDTKTPFPVLADAWTVIERRKSKKFKSEERIFNFRARTVTARHVRALHELIEAGIIKDRFVFNDYRYEAACRLIEQKHGPRVVAQATGQPFQKIVEIAEAIVANTRA
jgi:integrase